MNSAAVLTFEKDDKLALQGFSEDLEAYIETERHFVAGSLVISLDAPFGFGKSTFLRMWSTSLSERRKANPSLPIPITLNSWESDHCRDPLLGIVSTLSRELAKYEIPKEKIRQMREAAKDIAWFGLGLANSVVAEVTRIDVAAAGEFAEKKKSERAALDSKKLDLLASYEQRMAALDRLKSLLHEIFQPPNAGAIIMVDELDRCRPDYAVEFLEAIKHVFLFPGVSFVLAVDKGQLRSSVRTLYGQDLNFEEYYRKFSHRNIALPSVSRTTTRTLIKHYWDNVVIDGVRRPKTHSAAIFNETAVTSLEEVAASLNLGPRQIHEMLRIYGHVMARKNEKKGDLFWGFSAAAALLAGMAVGSPALYGLIGSKKATFQIIWEAIPRLLSNEDHGEWWLCFLGNGRAFSFTSYDEILERAKSVGLLSKVENGEHLKSMFVEQSSAWGQWHGERPFHYVYQIMEKLRRFENPPQG